MNKRILGRVTSKGKNPVLEMPFFTLFSLLISLKVLVDKVSQVFPTFSLSSPLSLSVHILLVLVISTVPLSYDFIKLYCLLVSHGSILYASEERKMDVERKNRC